MTKKITDEKAVKDLNKIPYVDAETEQNIVLSGQTLDRMMDGDITYVRLRTRADNQILILFFIMSEAIDKIYDDPDFKMMRKKYKTMIFIMERQWIERIYNRDFIYICHIEPYDEFSPGEYWIMNEQTHKDMNEIHDHKKIAERFTIAEDKIKVPKRHGI